MRRSRGGPPRARRAALLASTAAAALALSAILASCGLETVKAYSSPSITYDGGLLTLTHNAANDSDATFLGYEIYYRAYQDSASADADRAAATSFINSGTATPESCVLKLESMKFHRFRNYQGIDQRPLFPKGPLEFKTYLSVSPGWHVNDAPAAADFFFRSISMAGSTIPFNSDYAVADADYSGASVSTSPASVYFVFFALAYGFDFSANLKEIYSLPVNPGVTVTFSY